MGLANVERVIQKWKLWYDSQTSLCLVFVILGGLLLGFFIAATILGLAVGMVVVYCPWLCTIAIIALAAVPIAVILILLLGKGITRTRWCAAMACSVMLLVLSGGLFMFRDVAGIPFSIRKALFPSRSRFPLAWLGGISVSDSGTIYVSIQQYGRVQAYDKNGEFQRGWFVDSGGGLFDMWVDEGDLIHVRTVRTDKHLVFDPEGKLVKSIEIIDPTEARTLAAKAVGFADIDSLGNTYELRSAIWFPEVVKTDPHGLQKTLFSESSASFLLRYPQPGWHIGLLAFGLVFVLTYARRRMCSGGTKHVQSVTAE